MLYSDLTNGAPRLRSELVADLSDIEREMERISICNNTGSLEYAQAELHSERAPESINNSNDTNFSEYAQAELGADLGHLERPDSIDDSGFFKYA